METYSSAIVATSTTAATSVAEIEKFLSRRQSRQQRRCILLMETTGNFSSDGSDKNASQGTFHTVKTSGSATRPSWHILQKWRPVEKSMCTSSWKKCKSTTASTINIVKVIKTSILR